MGVVSVVSLCPGAVRGVISVVSLCPDGVRGVGSDCGVTVFFLLLESVNTDPGESAEWNSVWSHVQSGTVCGHTTPYTPLK